MIDIFKMVTNNDFEINYQQFLVFFFNTIYLENLNIFLFIILQFEKIGIFIRNCNSKISSRSEQYNKTLLIYGN